MSSELADRIASVPDIARIGAIERRDRNIEDMYIRFDNNVDDAIVWRNTTLGSSRVFLFKAQIESSVG